MQEHHRQSGFSLLELLIALLYSALDSWLLPVCRPSRSNRTMSRFSARSHLKQRMDCSKIFEPMVLESQPTWVLAISVAAVAVTSQYPIVASAQSAIPLRKRPSIYGSGSRLWTAAWKQRAARMLAVWSYPHCAWLALRAAEPEFIE